MARLTDELPVVMQGRETVNPVRPAPSLFEGLAGALNTGLSAVQEAGQVRGRRAALERQRQQDMRQAAEDARNNEERAAENAAALGYAEVFMPSLDNTRVPIGPNLTDSLPVDPVTGEADPAAVAAVQAADTNVSTLQSAQAAQAQGRMSPDAVNLRARTVLARLFREFPNQRAVILQRFKEHGITNEITREYEDVAEDIRDEQEFVREQRQAMRQAAFERGVPVDTDPVQAEEIGRRYVEAEDRLKQIETQQRIDAANRTMTREELELRQKQQSEEYGVVVSQYAGAELQNLLLQYDRLLADPTTADEEKLRRGQDLLARIDTGINARLREMEATVFPRMLGLPNGSAQVENIRNMMRGYVDMARQHFTGDNNIVARRQNILRLMETNLGIRTQQAMPIMNELRRVVGNDIVANTLMTTILGNTDLMNRARQELNGFMSLRSGEASTRIMNLAQLARGELNIRDLSPAEAREAVNTAARVAGQILNDPNVRSGRDADTHNAALTQIGIIANGAVEAVPQWGVRSLSQTITNILGNQKTVDALFSTGANRERRTEIIQGYLPALQNTVNALKQANTGDPYYRAQWNSRANRFEVVPTGRPIPTRRVGLSAADPRVPGGPGEITGPSEAVRMQVAALNRGVHVLSSAAAQGWDRTIPRETSSVDRLRFYATGQVPASVSQRNSQERRTARSSDQNWTDFENSVDRWISGIVPNPADSELGEASGSGDATRVMNYQARAAGFQSVPENVTTLGQASEFARQVNRANVPSSAMGTYQIVGETLRRYAPKVFGANWQNTPFNQQSQDRIAEAIFNDHKHSAAALRGQWVSLSLAEAERIRTLPWREARVIIARGESGESGANIARRT